MVEATAAALREAVEKNKPRPYDLNDPAEILRLYRECRGYLHTCHHKHGTDWEGRKFAMDALDALVARAAPPRQFSAPEDQLARAYSHLAEHIRKRD